MQYAALADLGRSSYDTGMAKQRAAILVAVFVLGAYALCAQAMLLREAQVLLFGSELSWGLILGFWLAGVAAGAQTAGRALRKSARPWLAFSVVCLAMPAVLMLEIVLLRTARSLAGATAGEYVGPGAMVWITLAAAFPVALCVGLTFPAAGAMLARADARPHEKARAVGWAYLVESAGGLVGGALYSFVLADRGQAIGVAMWGGAVLALAVGSLIHCYARLRWVALVETLLVILPAILASGGLARQCDEATVRWRWQTFASGLEFVGSEDSRYENLALGRLGGQFSLYTSGLVAATWPNHADAAIDAHLAACQSPSPKRILVLGGGADGPLAELARYRPERLDYVTLDPKLVAMIRPYLDEADRRALDGLAGRIHFTDIRRFVNRAAAGADEKYDLVLLAAPDPASTLEARLYTEEFFGQVASIMADDGVLAFALHGAVGTWSPQAAEYVGSIVLPLGRVFPDVLLTFGYPTWCFAARRAGVLTDSGEELARRYRAAGVESPFFDPLWFQRASDLLDPEKRATVRRAIETHSPAFLNTDGRPAAAMYHMRFWLQASEAGHPGAEAPARQRPDVLGALMRLRFDWVMLAAAAGALLVAAAGAVRGRAAFRRAALYWSVGTTGFATMALEIVLLYTFQTLYGYVYSMVGLVVGVFMFGLVLGSLAMNRRLRRGEADGLRRASEQQGVGMPDGVRLPAPSLPGMRTIVGLDLAMVLFACGLVIVLAILRESAADWAVQAATFALVAAAGVLGGLVFPLAASVALETAASTSRAAGVVDAADNAGACVGALVTGVLLVPVLGVSGACLAVAGLKAMSALVVGVAATVERAPAFPSA
jgi:spermidine synthase